MGFLSYRNLRVFLIRFYEEFLIYGDISWFIFTRNFELVGLVFKGNCWDFSCLFYQEFWFYGTVPNRNFLMEFVGFSLFILPGIYGIFPRKISISGIFPCLFPSGICDFSCSFPEFQPPIPGLNSHWKTPGSCLFIPRKSLCFPTQRIPSFPWERLWLCPAGRKNSQKSPNSAFPTLSRETLG